MVNSNVENPMQELTIFKKKSFEKSEDGEQENTQQSCAVPRFRLLLFFDTRGPLDSGKMKKCAT